MCFSLVPPSFPPRLEFMAMFQVDFHLVEIHHELYSPAKHNKKHIINGSQSYKVTEERNDT